MEPHDFLKLLHVLTFVYWLGADLGVFYAARVAAGPRLAVDTRAALFKVMSWIDLIPRTMLVLTFPIGAQLAAGLGISPIVGGWLWLVWIAAIGWAGLMLTVHIGARRARALAAADLFVRLAIVVALTVTATASFGTGTPFATEWLSLKVLLFAGVVACSVGVRLALWPLPGALERLAHEEAGAASEALMARAVRTSTPFVAGLWILIVAAAFAGLNHEALFGT